MDERLPNTPELDVAREAARRGAEIVCRHHRDGVTMRSKGVSDLVSDADTESEEAIVEVIRRAFPDHAILAEESHRGDAGAEHLWIVDPLDGTTNFAHRIPHFAVSIAYYRAGRAECGVVHNPVRGDWYLAVRGRGAFHDGSPIYVDPSAGLNDVLVGVGFYYDRGAMMEATLAAIHELFGRSIHGIRRFGTASLDLCQVATGVYGAFFEYELSPWDFAAGRLIVEEAGGRVTTCRGDDLPLARSTLLASNGHLHEAMLEIVGRHAPTVAAGTRGA
jgi:myo-inositol-1(or 4)-monophosphatase